MPRTASSGYCVGSADIVLGFNTVVDGTAYFISFIVDRE
jgi:hypothetical protein|tara:strand:- start:464 stop:580 length:117 start_codon:yes stop_codon:yes gene_type:complete